MPEIVADPPSPSCSHLFPAPRIQESQRLVLIPSGLPRISLPTCRRKAALLGKPASTRDGRRELVLRAEYPSEAAIRDWCVEYLARTLDLPDQSIDTEMTFARLGLDSANSVFLIVEL